MDDRQPLPGFSIRAAEVRLSSQQGHRTQSLTQLMKGRITTTGVFAVGTRSYHGLEQGLTLVPVQLNLSRFGQTSHVPLSHSLEGNHAPNIFHKMCLR